MTSALKKKLLLSLNRPIRPQDVFATSLYTGNGGTQTITNGLDLAGKGGLTWFKNRSVGGVSHLLLDTARGSDRILLSDLTDREASIDGVTFRSNGITVNNPYPGQNDSGRNYVNWTWLEAKRFFAKVLYTGNGQSGRQIPHGLGDVPGMVIIKRRDGASDWNVRHRSIASPNRLQLNATDGQNNGGAYSNDANTFTPAAIDNQNGFQYVAYLFAHNPDLIQCTSYVQQAGDTAINLGWKPQFALLKTTGTAGSWLLADTARGWDTTATKFLRANDANSETTDNPTYTYPTATGFVSKAGAYPSGTTIAGLFIRSPT